MIEITCFFSSILLYFSMVLGLYRLFHGPTPLDRILAFDYICGIIIALITLYSIQTQSISYIEIILIFSLLGFATIISFMELFFAKERKSK